MKSSIRSDIPFLTLAGVWLVWSGADLQRRTDGGYVLIGMGLFLVCTAVVRFVKENKKEQRINKALDADKDDKTP